MEREREALLSIISQWNQNRLDLFALSQPNEDNEFHGVMRFYFQDAGQKVATKCVRVSSTATATDVIKTLIEKFRPDIRMLSIPEYALYEIHENEGERKLADDEKPLLVQLNWHRDDREGRFLLRRMDEETHLPGFDPEHSNFKRKLSRREKKEKKKAEKEKRINTARDSAASLAKADRVGKEGEKLAEKLYNEVPETSFTRSISNPEAVMKRKRQQKLEKKLQQMAKEGGEEAGGTLRIFGETLNKDVPYRTLLLSTSDTAASVVQEILEKYGRDKAEASNYCLVQVVVPAPHGSSDTNASSDPNGIREVILDDSSCPLAIEKQHDRRTGAALSFHVRLRKRKKKYIKTDFEVNTDEIRERLHSLNPTNLQNDSRVSSTVPADLVSDAVQAHNKLNSVGCNFNGGNVECSERSASTNSGYGATDESAPLPNSPTSLSVPDGLTSPSPSSAANTLNNSVNITSHPSFGQDHHSIPDSNHSSFPHDMQASQMMPAPSSIPSSVRKGPEVVVYMLQKGNGGMGLSIVATKGIGQEKLGIYIKTVVKGGAADLDGRLEAGDQLLSVDGNSLIGVSQEKAAELISKSGQVVTLEVAKSAANYNGLASILSQPSPLVSRNRLPHSTSYQGSLLPQQQSQPVLGQTGQPMTPIMPQHYPNSLPYQAAMNASVHNQTMSPVPGSPGGNYLQPALHNTSHQSILPTSMNAAALQEERHYQNIGMYLQQVPTANGMSAASLASINGTAAAAMRPFNGNNGLSTVYPSGSATLHNSYSSMHSLPQPSAQMTQLNSQTLPSGRPLSTVYPPHMMSRVPSIAQYPSYASQGAIYNRAGQLTGSVPALHPASASVSNQHLTGQQWRNPYESTNSLMYQAMPTGPQGLYPTRNSQLASASRVSVMRPPEEPIPAVSYRYGPSGYPAKQMDTLNNNTNNNANNPASAAAAAAVAINGITGNQWSKRNSSSSNNINNINSNNTVRNNSTLDINAQLEEQEERLRQLKLEEQRRQQELEMASLVEAKLLNEAKSRRQDDQSKSVKGYLTNSSDQLFSAPYVAMNNGGGPSDSEQIHPHMAPKSPTLHYDSGLIINSSSSRNTVPSNSTRYHPSGINANSSGTDVSHHSTLNNNNNHAQDILHLQETNCNFQLDQQPLQHVPQHQRYPSALKNGDVHSIVNHNNNKNSSGPGGAPKKVSWNDSNLQHTSINASINDNEDEIQSSADHDDEQDELNTMSDINNDTANATAGSSDFTLQDIDEVLCSSTEQEGTPLHPNTPNVIGSQEVYRDPRERMMLEKMKNQMPKAVQGPEKLSFQEKMKMFAMESGGTIASKGVKSNPSQLASGKTESSDNNRSDSP